MSFILFLVAGFFSGMLGGMGMGGGTVLIPTFTILLGVEQHVAQATNLIAFLPMALFTLKLHKRAMVGCNTRAYNLRCRRLCRRAFAFGRLKKAFRRVFSRACRKISY